MLWICTDRIVQKRGSGGDAGLWSGGNGSWKRGFCIHQSGRWYTNDNIDQMLMERHLAGKARRASKKNHLKGSKKRTAEDDERFVKSLEELIQKASVEHERETGKLE